MTENYKEREEREKQERHRRWMQRVLRDYKIRTNNGPNTIEISNTTALEQLFDEIYEEGHQDGIEAVQADPAEYLDTPTRSESYG